MKSKFIKASGFIAGAILASSALSAFALEASVGVSTNAKVRAGEVNTGVKAEARMDNLSAKDDAAIQARIEALNKMSARLQSMEKLSAASKASISATIKSSVDSLVSLKAKIDADTDAATLKEDSKSITAAYRVYALVLPQAAIMAAADRINTVAGLLTSISVKLEARINEAKAAGKDVSAFADPLMDLKLKISDASVQASAALSAVASLKADNGDSAVAASNHAALVAARAKIKAGKEDLEAARKDAQSIVSGFKEINAKASASITAK